MEQETRRMWESYQPKESDVLQWEDTEPEVWGSAGPGQANSDPSPTSAAPAPRRSWSFQLLLALLTSLLVSLLLVHIWASGEATSFGFAYAQALQRGDRLQEERRCLQLQVESLRDLARLSRIAGQELGMQLPRQVQVIFEDPRGSKALPLRPDEQIAIREPSLPEDDR